MKARRILRESNETLKEGYGFANQKEDCIKFENKHDIETVKEHETVESSTTWKRDELEEIINEAIREKDAIPCVIFPRVDRHARKLAATGYYTGMLLRNGLTVCFAQQNLKLDDKSSPMDILMLFLHGFKAEEDAEQIKHNLLGGRDKLASKAHEIPNGMVMWPFDYMAKRIYGKMSTGKPSINKERANWVRKWVEWMRDEGIGINEVCRRMKDAGVITRRGVKFSPKAIRDILRSRQLIGEFWWKGQLYLKDDGLRILADEEFETVQKILGDNRDRSFYNATKYDYPPFRKMVFCGHHPSQIMYGKPIGSTTWYYCPKCKKEKYTNQIRCRVIWEQYQHEIKGILLREERLIPALKEQYDNKDTIIRLEQHIKAKTNEIQKWDDAKDAAFQMGMSLRNYPQERVQEQIDKAEENLQRINLEKIDLVKRLKMLKEQRLNEEGIKRFCQIVARNINQLTKNQWGIINKLLRLRITVFSKELVTVNVALPPVIDMKDSEIEFSCLSILK